MKPFNQLRRFGLFLLLAVMLSSFLVSCGCGRQYPPQPYAENVWGPGGGDPMTRVNYYDQATNQWLSYYIAYSMFNRLYSSGGYDAVNNYYRTNPTMFTSNMQQQYRMYDVKYRPANSTIPIRYGAAYNKYPASPITSGYASPTANKKYTAYPSYTSPNSNKTTYQPTKQPTYKSPTSNKAYGPSPSYRSPSSNKVSAPRYSSPSYGKRR